MKAVLLVVVLGVIYWGWNYYNNQLTGDPVYAEFRVKYENGLELVGFGRMNSQSDCQMRAAKVWGNLLVSSIKGEISSVNCGVQLTARYESLFANEIISATYIAMDRGNAGERDGRLIIFGVPSSEVIKVCPSMISMIKQKYNGTVKCIQGRVG